MTKANVDRVAIAVAVLVLIVGGVLVAHDGPTFDPPTKQTTVVEEGTGAGVGKRTVATEKGTASGQEDGAAKDGEGGEGAGGTATTTDKRTETVEMPTGQPSGKRTETTEVTPRSWIERALGDGGLVLLVIGAILLVAFFAAAFVQRLLLGDFTLKIGPLELSALQAKADKPILDLTAEITKRQEKQDAALEQLGLRASDAASHLVTLGIAVSDLNKRVSELERKTGGKKDGK